MILWMNGKYITEKDCTISPFDHSFLYGIHFFEKFRTYKGHVVLFQEHYNRLVSKLNQFRIRIPYSVTEILKVIKELKGYADEKDGIYLLNVSTGIGQSPLQFQSSYNQPNVMIFRTDLFPRKRGEEKEAKWLYVQEDANSIIEQKFLGSLEIENMENVEGFLLRERRIITEGLASNIFFAKENTLFTPSLALGVTPGITRQWVINTAKQMGYRLVEDLFIKKDLEDAYECFVTNSIDELVPISNIENVQFLGRDGTIYQRLQHAYIDEILRTVKKGE